MKQTIILAFMGIIILGNGSCTGKSGRTEDSIYSRHLQKHLELIILHTPVPQQKNQYNLLILNDGQDIDQLKVEQIMDSLYRINAIKPLLVVAIRNGNRLQEYGVAGFPDYQHNGANAKKYSDFVDNELYPFIKKKAGVRKFASVCIAGCSLGGLSAFDIAWNHADKINKVGVFSGSFWWRDKDAAAPDYSDANNRIMLKVVRSSRKRPHLKYWFYAGASEETADRDNDGIIDVVDDTQDMINILKAKNIYSPADIVYKELAEGRHDYGYWSRVFPEFLVWAVGK